MSKELEKNIAEMFPTTESLWFDNGKISERERIIKLLEPLFDTAENAETRRLLIQGIALIKGENKHTHEIEIFGAPCLGGDYHEYCLKCGWVEPCEIDGENK